MALTDNLIAHWKLNEASGNRADSVDSYGVSANTGSIVSAAGKIGDGAYFGATTKNWLGRGTPGEALFAVSAYTIAGWIKRTSDFASNYDAIRLFKVSDGTNGKYDIPSIGLQKYGSTHYAQIAQYDSSGDAIVKNHSDNLAIDTWYFIVSRWNGTIMSVSVNAGTPQTELAGSLWQYAQVGEDNYIVIGSRNVVTVNAVIDSVSWWHRCLSDDEVTTLYNSGDGLDYPFPSTLITSFVLPVFRPD